MRPVLRSSFLSSLLLILALSLPVLPVQPAAEGRIYLQAVIPACSPITTDTTWVTGNVYVVNNCVLIVQAGATLTIQPGVVVKFGPTSDGLRVDGRLIAQGTAAQPIIFTSLADDSAGGDTNGDSSATVPAAGDWYGMVLTSGSETTLDYVQVRYAGGSLFNGILDGWSDAQIEVKAGAQFTMTNSEVRAGGRMGIYLNGGGLTPTIHSVHIADHANTGNSWRYALLQSTINMQPSYRDITFSGNTRNEVTIDGFNGPLAQDVTLGGAVFGAKCGFSLCQLIVPAGRTLTIAPGTWLQFEPGFGIAVANGGTLRAVGTADQPIVFTSASPQTPTYWLGLWAQSGSTLRLSHCDISYGDDGNFGDGGLEINTTDATVENCRIHHNRETGLFLYAPSNSTAAAVLTNVDVTDNGKFGVDLETSSGGVLNVTWDGGRIADNGWAGFGSYTRNGIISPTLRHLTIANNGTRADTDYHRGGIYWDDHNVDATVSDLHFAYNVGPAFLWYCNGSITARNLTATGNGTDELTIPGCTVSRGRQWDLDGIGIPVRVTYHIVLSSNALLSLAPGTVLRFDKNKYNGETRLEVSDQASLIALGTAEKPIIFTANTPTPGWWEGISAYQRATVTLRHCEVAYGGGRTRASVDLSWGYPDVGLPVVNIQNCEIHHSASRGVRFDFQSVNVPTPPILQYNHLHDTAEVAVANWGNVPVLDARNNYWDHSSGPYHSTQNPGGQGDDVGDNILFYPWLRTPQSGEAPATDILLRTGGPERYSPGEIVDYVVQYLNPMTMTVQGAVVMMRLPSLAYYIESSDGGVYWPARHQVIWRLGDMMPGAQGRLWVRVQYRWGIPPNQPDTVATVLSAQNYNAGLLNLEPYLSYTPTTMTAYQTLSRSQWDSFAASMSQLQALHAQALAAGYLWASAERITLNTGIVSQAVFINPQQRSIRLIQSDGAKAFASTFAARSFSVTDGTGGMEWNIATDQERFWGTWDAIGQAAWPGTLMSPELCSNGGCCLRNCIGKVALKTVAGKLADAIDITLTGVNCVMALRSREVADLANCAADIKSDLVKVDNVPVFGEIADLTECLAECAGNPSSHDCTGDLTTCEEAWWNLYQWVGVPNRTVWRCVSGCYTKPEVLPCALNECCVPGVGCASSSQSGVNCQKNSRLVIARDPNDITGPAGDLLPGQTITYTIRYENEGDGRAYGVYVVNQLPDALDANTVTFVNRSGTYLPATRELVWTIGELGPKGAADSQGIITYTVQLRSGLASGTVVANQAVVYFPSVPEETPTNTWVNLVAPLVAEPQSITTTYRTSRAITLRGREASDLPLTYEVVEQPRGGTLTGTAPNLTYTPSADFTGVDAFTFRVSNGTSTSRAAQVSIEVTPQGDTTPPRVLWSNLADATGLASTPIYTDTEGVVYGPVVLVEVSEALDETTLTPTTVTLTRDGTSVAASVRFDSGANYIVVTPRSLLHNGVYRVTVTTGVKDVAGNALAAPYTMSFTIGTRREVYVPLVAR
ncbi:right-handed parallel beta-helix repeat-containing protein [uncultured Chloroflexus sp.]|uniref:right-handed parallel beta-helix repeat-containing protein n=1 Tax=uncultured Chloroflexus sp. TaxID=214040 RepID=UPI00262211D6|nr:right-handed parallel beta-helix repeat-containing protein [uncultured Chloroflexus sp.]